MHFAQSISLGTLAVALAGCAATTPSAAPIAVVDAEPAAAAATAPTVADAQAFVKAAEADLFKTVLLQSRADWVNNTYVTEDSDAVSAYFGGMLTEKQVKYAKEAARFAQVPGLDYDTTRKLNILRSALSLAAPDRPGAAEELSTLTVGLQSMYAKGRATLDGEVITGDVAEDKMGSLRNPTASCRGSSASSRSSARGSATGTAGVWRAPRRSRSSRRGGDVSAATRVQQHVDAPRAVVYRLLLDPAAVARWKVPDGMTAIVHRFEPREGGAIRVSLVYDAPTAAGKSAEHTDTYHGRFVRLVPDELVVEADEFETDDPALRGEMISTIALADAPGGGTIVTGVHEGLPSAVSAEDNETGWRMALAKLAALAEAAPQSP